jgi:cell division protein FtsW
MKKLALTIFFASLALMLLGLIIVLSASSTFSEWKFENAFYLFNAHLLKAVIGFVFMLVFSIIPYDKYRGISKWAMVLMAFVLLYTLLFASTIKGAGRWLNLGLFTVQPADIAKLVLIIHLAYYIERKGEAIQNLKGGLLIPLFWVGTFSLLIFFQPNVSNAILLVVVAMTMLFVGGARIKHVLAVSGGGLILALGLAMSLNHSRQRILNYIYSLQDKGDVHHQVQQALYGLGNGGIIGSGLGKGGQHNLFLPEAYGDFIFAIIGEEIGLLGAVSVLIVFLIMFGAGIILAKKAKDKFGQLIAFGISFSVALYAFTNVAIITGLVPTTGLPMPFISYGGTSLIFLCISIGVLLNIAYRTNQLSKAKSNISSSENDELKPVKI